MLSQFLAKQLGRAKYKILLDGDYFASIPGLRGVWASAGTLEGCRTELQSVLEDWLLLRLRNRSMIPGLRLPVVSRTLRRPMSSRGDISQHLLSEILHQASISSKDWNAR